MVPLWPTTSCMPYRDHMSEVPGSFALMVQAGWNVALSTAAVSTSAATSRGAGSFCPNFDIKIYIFCVDSTLTCSMESMRTPRTNFLSCRWTFIRSKLFKFALAMMGRCLSSVSSALSFSAKIVNTALMTCAALALADISDSKTGCGYFSSAVTQLILSWYPPFT